MAYTGSHPLHDWTGVSNDISGTIELDPEDPAGASIALRVPIESFDSGNSNRDSNMLEVVEVFLWPEVIFISDDIEVEEWNDTEDGIEGIWTVTGILSFHGEEKRISTEVALSLVRDVIQAAAAFEIELDAFEIDRPKLMLTRIRNELQVEANLVFRRAEG